MMDSKFASSERRQRRVTVPLLAGVARRRSAAMKTPYRNKSSRNTIGTKTRVAAFERLAAPFALAMTHSRI
jgi:hypothetical protein